MIGYLLDTHYWIWLQQANAKQLKPAARNLLTEAQRNAELFVSAISVLEVARRVAERKIDLGCSVDRFVQDGLSMGGLRLIALAPQILIESTRLPGGIHGDPSDRILAATAREHGLVLLTRDRLLLDYAKQGHVNARII